MAEAGAAVVIPDAALTPERLRAEVDAVVGDAERLARMRAASAALARPEAAREIAAEVLAAARASTPSA
jgi:UDP-N-acetylglucosamine--N-acetylmuramyl-(pentapeptide) pyrophosphoryl-undecaprenol N-acetylglucosamine transferase